MKTKAIGYVRVSTDKQAEHGVSLEAQVEKIRAMATVHDVELLDVLVDAGESAKDLDRPGMVRILEMVQSRAVGMVSRANNRIHHDRWRECVRNSLRVEDRITRPSVPRRMVGRVGLFNEDVVGEMSHRDLDAPQERIV